MKMITYVTELNTENFHNIISKNRIVVVDIWALWCGPCKTLSPIIDEVGSYFGEKILVGKLDADSNSEIIKEIGVRNIPTVLIYKDGDVVDRFVGVKSKQDIINIVENII
jgi:thioredoxin 1